MIQIWNEKKNCCGCSACHQVCPRNCIIMVEDEEGFKYPEINEEKCVDCGLCESVCPIIQKPSMYVDNSENMPKAIGGWHIDNEIRYDSSSGGAFTLFAEYIIKHGGIVFGCALNDKLKAVHLGIENIDELYKLRGSKYVQSDISDAFVEIRQHLRNGRLVLFTGTPCQAAGLNSFLNKRYDNLFICDFICHGVPSPKVFNSYISSLEEKYQDRMVGFRFRNKDKGWNPSGLQLGTEVKFKSGTTKRYSPAYRDAFMNGFWMIFIYDHLVMIVSLNVCLNIIRILR